MSVQTADTLQKQVHRAQVGRQQIEIQIKRLLDDLRADNDEPIPLRRRRILADEPQKLLLAPCAVRHHELRMEHEYTHPRQCRPQPRGGLLRPAHGIDDHACAAAVRKRVPQPFGQVFERFALDRNRFRRSFGRDRALAHVQAVRPCKERIGQAVLPRRAAFQPERLGLARAAPQIRLYECRAPFFRQRRRQDDDRRAVSTQPGQCAVEIGVHVR